MKQIGFVAALVLLTVFVGHPAMAEDDPVSVYNTIPGVSRREAPEEGKLPSFLWWVFKTSTVGAPVHSVTLRQLGVTYIVVEHRRGTLIPKSSSDTEYEAYDTLLETAPGVPVYRSKNCVYIGFRYDHKAPLLSAPSIEDGAVLEQFRRSAWAFVYILDRGSQQDTFLMKIHEAEVDAVVGFLFELRRKEQEEKLKNSPRNDNRVLPGD